MAALQEGTDLTALQGGTSLTALQGGTSLTALGSVGIELKKQVSNLVFYAQSGSAVISGRLTEEAFDRNGIQNINTAITEI